MNEQFLASLQPIIDRLAGGPMDDNEVRGRIASLTGESFTPRLNVFRACKAADNLPPNCDGCCEDISGNLICCQEINHEPR